MPVELKVPLLCTPPSFCTRQGSSTLPLPVRKSPDPSFLLLPLSSTTGIQPNLFPCVGWSYLCSAPAHMAVPGVQQSKSTSKSLRWRRWGCPHGTVGLILVFSVLPPALPSAFRPPLRFVGPGQIRAQHQRTQKGHKAPTPPWISRLSVFSPLLAALR